MTVTQSRKLLGIPEEKFNLKAQLVELVNLLGVLLDIGAEQQSGANPIRSATVYPVDDSNFPFQGDVPYPCGVQVNVGLERLHPGQPGQVLKVNFAVILARSAPCLLHPGVEIAQGKHPTAVC